MSGSKHRIYFLLQRAAHRLKTEADAALIEDSGLTTAQSAVMTIIAEHGPVSQKFVAETLSQRESAVTAMAARLVKSGFITKTRSTRDSRAFELNVTTAGTEVLERTRVRFGEINAKIDQQISGPDMQAFAENLTKILETFASEASED